MKAKYQDNLEMLQWIKRFFDLNYNGAPYDALGRRKGDTLYLIGAANALPQQHHPPKAAVQAKPPFLGLSTPPATAGFKRPVTAAAGAAAAHGTSSSTSHSSAEELNSKNQ